MHGKQLPSRARATDQSLAARVWRHQRAADGIDPLARPSRPSQPPRTGWADLHAQYALRLALGIGSLSRRGG